jgi:hypothetical protein
MAYTTINKPSDYFNTKLYTGNGSTQSITGVGFKPDWVWIKERNNANSHRLFDGVRGVHKKLFSNSTSAEVTDVNSLTSFTADGFDSGSDSGMNGNTNSYVSWNWLASNTTASNTDGSITSTVSANTTSGFSIVSYTGTGSNATVGHGLGVAPSWIVIKGRNQTEDWTTYHISTGNTKNVILNSTAVPDTSTTYWQDTSPTSSVFYLGSSTRPNTSGGTYIAYCFAEKTGFSKFGSYIANNDDGNGPFIYTGFKPAFVMIKGSTSTSTYKSWCMFDTTRQPFNVNAGKTLYANKDYPEGQRGQGTVSATIPAIDMLSNGFKIKVFNDEVNNGTNTFIYMAFAEAPLVGSNGVTAKAK